MGFVISKNLSRDPFLSSIAMNHSPLIQVRQKNWRIFSKILSLPHETNRQEDSPVAVA